ncbi:MAG: tetratricopeptide repeat protein [Chlorobi bacterium]|nr:tetratricopeptide repeat protein [Chlorobiota bacterium]
MIRRYLKILFVILSFLLSGAISFTQTNVADSLQSALKSAHKDQKLVILHQLCKIFLANDNRLSESYAKEAIVLSRELKKPEKEAQALNDLAKTYFFRGDYEQAEQNYIASLGLYEQIGNNAGIAGTLNNIGVLYRSKGDYGKALEYYQQSLEIKRKMGDKQGIANTRNNIGEIHKFRGEYPEAVKNYQESYELKKELGDKWGMANSLNNLGEIYSIWSEYEKALGYYLDAAALWDELNNSSGTAGAYHNIGEIYKNLENYDMAEKYYKKAMKIQRATNDNRNLASTLRHLGAIYMDMKKYDIALEDFTESLAFEQQLENKSGVANTLENLGELYFHRREYQMALKTFEQALSINQEIGNRKGVSSNYTNMSEALLKLNKPHDAVTYYGKSLSVARELGVLSIIQNDYLGLAHAYQQMGNYRKALNYYFNYQSIKDTLLNEQIHKQIAELETKYQTRQKEKELQLKDAELMRKDLEIKQQNLQRNAILTGLFMVILLAAVVYRNYRQKQKANEILTRQKAEIELKNTEITDSIRYAQHIQNAFLPHEKYIKELFTDIFVFFRPKDIVSGDFYWFGESHGYKYAAAVDATGHGVPGAFISLLGYNLLNNILKENPEITPARMLDELNKGFSERMFKSYQEQALRDSMDIALCRIDPSGHRLTFAGAYNPLWIARNGKMLITKGDKFPIGSYQEDPGNHYHHHEIELQVGDVFYIFSDGYADQFGGDKGKKFMYRQMRELLLEISSEPVVRQQGILEKKMDKWKRDYEQIDDQLIIGIRYV